MIKRISMFILLMLSLVSLSYSIGWHSASEILDGTFSGNYLFSGDVNFTDANVIGLDEGVWNVISNDLYYEAGNVGIGTSTPNVPFVIDTEGNNGFQLSYDAIGWDTDDGFTIAHSGGNLYLNQREDADIRFWTNNLERMTIENDGDVGIGTNNPWGKFHLNEEQSTSHFSTYIYSPNLNSGAFVGFQLGRSNVNSGALIFSYDIASLGGDDLLAIGHPTDDINNGGGLAIRKGGNVGLGLINPNVKLDIDGSIEYTGSITDVSDMRLKENIIQLDNSLNKIQNINGYTFNMINESSRQIGVMAQEIQGPFPEAVSYIDDDKDYLGVDYTQLVPVLLEAIKELKEEKDNEIEDLRKEIELLKSK